MVCAFSLLPALAASTGLKPLEVRMHWRLANVAAGKPMPEDVRKSLEESSPEGTLILRNMYENLPKDGRQTPEGAVESQSIVLFDLKTESGLRLVYRRDRDYQRGKVSATLTLMYRPLRKEVFHVRYSLPVMGSDQASTIREGRRQADKGHLDRDDEVLLTFEYGGREWTAPVSEWRHGTLLPEDMRLLKGAIDERLRQQLHFVDAVARVVPSLNEVCVLITHPLLEEYEDRCKSPAHPISLGVGSGPPDCDFDASFGEPCTQDQMEKYKLRKNSQIAPPAEVQGGTNR